MDTFSLMRNMLNERYRRYARLLFTFADIEREEKIKQISNALEDMIVIATEVMSYLTDVGMSQLQFNLTRNPRLIRKKKNAVAASFEIE